MKKCLFIVAGLALLVSFFGAIGCDDQTSEEDEQTSEESDFNLVFKYGVTAGNELNTFEGTYTKDMVMDPPITVELSLSEEEKQIIYQKMVEIDFFSYPDEFSVSVPPDEPISIVTPYASYYFKVEYNSEIKELSWKDEIVKEDEKADKLRGLIKFIRDIVESKEEYQELPEPTSGYL
jgi:hypothetical protein